MRSRHFISLVAAAFLPVVLAPPARAVFEETRPQYQQRYGKALFEMNVDDRHPGLIFDCKPFRIWAVFEGDKSVGEIHFKASGISSVDIASVLRQNGGGLNWRKENVTMSKGDAEKMKAQGIMELQMWSRSDNKAFAGFMRAATGTGKARKEMGFVLVGNKKGVKLVTELDPKRQWVPKALSQ